MRTRKDDSPTQRMIRPLVWGSVIGMAVCAVLLMVAAAIMTTGALSKTAVTVVAMAVVTIAAVVGGWLSARLSGERGLLYGAANGLLCFLVVTLCSVLFSRELRAPMLLLRAMLTVFGGAFGGVLGVNMKKR